MIAQVQRRHVVLNDRRDLLGQTTDGKPPVNLPENTPENDARRLPFADERHFDVDGLVELDLDEVRVKQIPGDRVDGVVAQQRGDLLAVDAELYDRVLPVLALQNLAESLGRNRQGDAGEALSVGHGGHVAFATQTSGGGLARL